jgi:hypothetical protein
MSNRRHKSASRSRWTDYWTPTVSAYLDALVAWTTRHVSDVSATITIPTGRVTASELVKVLRALEMARSDQRSNRVLPTRGGFRVSYGERR